MFLAETWLDETRLNSLKERMKFGDSFGVSRVTRGGGLALFWKKDIDLVVEDASQNYIDAIINKGKEGSWRFTGFYGYPGTQNHLESWRILRRLQQQSNLPWLCAGHFIEITKSHEKVGGRPRPNQQMQEFRDVFDDCGFVDLGFVGNKFTWYKSYPNGTTIWERLDRVVGSHDWLSLFPATKVCTLESGTSDHKPIIIHPMGINTQKQRP